MNMDNYFFIPDKISVLKESTYFYIFYNMLLYGTCPEEIIFITSIYFTTLNLVTKSIINGI